MEMLFLLTWIQLVSAFNLKIEQSPSNQTILNETITFNKNNRTFEDNTDTYTHIENFNTNRPTDITPRYLNTEILQIIQRRNDNSDIKRKLDKFVMSRKKSYITTVKFNFNMTPVKKIQNHVDKLKYMRKLDMNNEKNQEIHFNNIFKHPDLEEVLKKQNILIDRLNKVLLEEKRVLRSDFKSLIEDMEKLKNDTITEKQVVIHSPVTPNTVMNIDETAIREALKKDPLIRRVLQMGRNKRVVYEKETKEFVKRKIPNI